MLEELKRELSVIRYTLTDRQDLLWLETEGTSITALAQIFRRQGGRLVSMSAMVSQDGEEVTIYYHFDIGGNLYNIKMDSQDSTIASISPMFPNSEWFEREIRELYGVHFEGHPNPAPLFLNMGPQYPLKRLEKELIQSE